MTIPNAVQTDAAVAKRPENEKDTSGTEEFIRSVGARFGFRTGDFSVTWDGGELDFSRTTHELVIKVADGRTAAVELDHVAVVRSDRWKLLRGIEAAFGKLAHRTTKRGDRS